MGAILPCMRGHGGEEVGRQFVSQPLRREFREFAWQEREWTCSFCRARWTVTWSTWEGQGSGEPILQHAEHAGWQREIFHDGGAGACLQCDVVWVEATD